MLDEFTSPLTSNALDVSGNVNATGIVVGGLTAKQIDCGTATAGSSTTVNVSFNFTFTNIPKVVCTPVNLWGNMAFAMGVTVSNISTTGFTLLCSGIYNTTISVIIQGTTIQWIAIG